MNLNALTSSLAGILPGNTVSAERAAAQRQESLLNRSQASMNKLAHLVSKRVEQLNRSMTDIAQSLAKGFAGAVLGEAADGAEIRFDGFSLASQSSFSAASLQQTDENGSISAAGFSLEDASQFIGHGTITTADGRSFEFELEVRYSASVEAVAVEQRTGGQGQAKLLEPANFAGTAAELFERLRSEPVRLPFALQLPEQTEDNAAPLFGDLALRLLGLPAGERYLDLLPQADGEASPSGRVDLLA